MEKRAKKKEKFLPLFGTRDNDFLDPTCWTGEASIFFFHAKLAHKFYKYQVFFINPCMLMVIVYSRFIRLYQSLERNSTSGLDVVTKRLSGCTSAVGMGVRRPMGH